MEQYFHVDIDVLNQDNRKTQLHLHFAGDTAQDAFNKAIKIIGTAGYRLDVNGHWEVQSDDIPYDDPGISHRNTFIVEYLKRAEPRVYDDAIEAWESWQQ